MPLLKVCVWICTHIEYFCWQSFVFPPISNLFPCNRGGRCREGLEDHHIQTGPCNSIGKEQFLWIHVLRANRGECQHAVCHEYHEKHSKEQKRSRGCVLSKDDMIKSCHHDLRNLQICADIWWCTGDHLGGPQWFDHPKGCAFCERMFNVGEKWMRMFCVKKIWTLKNCCRG